MWFPRTSAGFRLTKWSPRLGALVRDYNNLTALRSILNRFAFNIKDSKLRESCRAWVSATLMDQLATKSPLVPGDDPVVVDFMVIHRDNSHWLRNM